MGSSGSTTNPRRKKKANEINTEKKQIAVNQPTNMKKTQRIPEAIINKIDTFIDLDPNTEKILSKKICRIVIESKGEKIEGTGFFLAFPIDLELFYCLMTNEHIISNESINNNNIIFIIFYF
jgi:hypothetical protein